MKKPMNERNDLKTSGALYSPENPTLYFLSSETLSSVLLTRRNSQPKV
jgi:hypothetical protein